MFDYLPAFPRSVVAFVIVLGVLVFVHEFGHYLAARWRRVHVETFSIGFGRALWTRMDRRGTLWKIGWVPLGGYVKLHGQERPEDVAPEVRARWIPGMTFHEKSVASRSFIVAAGPIANFALAAVLLFGLYVALGKPVTPPPDLARALVGTVMPGSPAHRAGLQKGDLITAIDAVAVARFEEVQRIVQASAGKELVLHVQRGDAALDIAVVPDGVADAAGAKTGRLGIQGGDVRFETLSLPVAVTTALAQTWSITVETLDGVWGMITRRNTGEDFGGPLRIAQMSGEIATLGFSNLVFWIALLSVNLGLINLFPIPVLDGGHLMFFLAEAVRGKPLPPKAQEYGFRAGFALLIGLFAFATFKDLGHIGVFRWVASLIG